jgi:hypothetical protein
MSQNDSASVVRGWALAAPALDNAAAHTSAPTAASVALLRHTRNIVETFMANLIYDPGNCFSHSIIDAPEQSVTGYDSGSRVLRAAFRAGPRRLEPAEWSSGTRVEGKSHSWALLATGVERPLNRHFWTRQRT